MRKAQIVNDEELFKNLSGFFWEFSTLYNGKAYRLGLATVPGRRNFKILNSQILNISAASGSTISITKNVLYFVTS